jgi:putative ABC transport system ATP-binding protein
MIELSQITKVYNAGKANEFKALHGIDLSIATNSVTVLTGPSGSGKTTLLSVIGCMARPTTGRIMIDGQETTSLPETFMARVRRSTFGFVFQDHNLIKGISVLENTMLPAYPGGEPFKPLRNRAMAILDRLDIAHKADRRSNELSGGERQRASIARALINDPAVVIADEPTAHLDTGLTGSFLEIVSDLAARGKTLLIASHDPLVYQSDAVGRVLEMRDGKLLGDKQSMS